MIMKLQCRVQRPGESLLDFAGELRMIASKAFPDWSNGQLEGSGHSNSISCFSGPTDPIKIALQKIK